MTEEATRPARAGTLLTPNSGAMAILALISITEPDAAKRTPLTSEEFWIGSSSNNNLCLESDPAVSGNHACIRLEDSFYRLYDNGSLNNTYVNGRPIGREVVLLHPGDRIRIGHSEFTLGV